MKILTGEMDPSKGSVTRPKKLGVLRQDRFAFDAFRVLDTVIRGNAHINYETVITYTGGYDDMVLTKTQMRSRIESRTAQCEKKIAQLSEFIARFSAGTRSSQVTSRKKAVERLQTSRLSQSNIQRPRIQRRLQVLRRSERRQNFGASLIRGILA